MKNKTKFISIILSISTLITLVSCQKKKAEWKGTIEEVDGVTIVKNPNEPLYGEILFDLEEDLIIGREDDENYLFFRIGDIEVDGDGNIYVFEFGNRRVQKFDRDGKYIRTIGRTGEGPGEYQNPYEMLINDKRGIIGVMDMRLKLTIFDKDGNHLDKDISFEKHFHDLMIDSSGTLWGYCFKLSSDDEATADVYKVLTKLSNNGQIVEKFGKFQWERYRERVSGGVLSISTGEEFDLYISMLGERNIVYGYSKEYELSVIDLEGNLQTKIKKDEPYRSFTTEEKQKYKKAKLPDYKSFFYHLFADSEERIYVQRTHATRIEDVEKTFDVFSKDGYYLYKTVFPFAPFVIKKGFFYTRVTNEETGEVFVKRYKIINWEQIKRGI